MARCCSGPHSTADAAHAQMAFVPILYPSLAPLRSSPLHKGGCAQPSRRRQRQLMSGARIDQHQLQHQLQTKRPHRTTTQNRSINNSDNSRIRCSSFVTQLQLAIWIAISLILFNPACVVDAQRFGRINPAYECEPSDDNGNGACNPWMRKRICDTGIVSRSATGGADILPSPDEDEAFWPDHVSDRDDASKIWFGFLGPLSGEDSRAETTSMLGLLCGLERVRNDRELLDGFGLDVVFADTIGIATGGTAGALCMHEVGVPVVIGPSFSGVAVAAAGVSSIFRMPMVATTASSPRLGEPDPLTKEPRLTRVIPNDRNQGKALGMLVEYYEWTRVVTLRLGQDEYADGVVGAFVDNSLENNFKVTLQEIFDASSTETELRAILKRIKASGTSVVLLAAYSADARNVLKVAKSLKMMDDGWAWLGTDAWITDRKLAEDLTDGETDPVGTGVLGLVPHVARGGDEWKSLSSCYANHSADINGPFEQLDWLEEEPNWISAMMYDAVLSTANTLETFRSSIGYNLPPAPSSFAGSFDADLRQQTELFGMGPIETGTDIMNIARQIQFDGATGRVEMDPATGERTEPVYDIINIRSFDRSTPDITKLEEEEDEDSPTLYRLGKKKNIWVIGAINPLANNANEAVKLVAGAKVLFPGPTETQPKSSRDTCNIGELTNGPVHMAVGSVMMSIAFMLVVVCLTFNVLWRENKIVKVSSWRVNLLTITGALLIYLSLYVEFALNAQAGIPSCKDAGALLNQTVLSNRQGNPYAPSISSNDSSYADPPTFVPTIMPTNDSMPSAPTPILWLRKGNNNNSSDRDSPPNSGDGDENRDEMGSEMQQLLVGDEHVVVDTPCLLPTTECAADAGSRICQTHYWLMGVGWTVAFGSLFAKMYRVSKLFSRQIRRVKIPDTRVMGYVCVLTLPMIIFLTVWSILDPPQLRLSLAETFTDELTSRTTYEIEQSCDGTASHDTYVIIFVFYLSCMVLLGAMIAWSVKEVWIKEVNDSFSVAMCIYTIIIVGGLGNTISYLMPEKDMSLLTGYVVSWLCVTVCLIFLFFPKMYQVWLNRNNDDVDLSHVVDRVNVFDIDMATMTQSMFDELGQHQSNNSDLCVECGRHGDIGRTEHEEESALDTADTTNIKTSFFSRFTTRRTAAATKSSSLSTEHRPGCSRYIEHGTNTRDRRSGSHSGDGSRYARHQDIDDADDDDEEEDRDVGEFVVESVPQSQEGNKGSIYDFGSDFEDVSWRTRSYHGLESANTFASSVDDGADMRSVQVTIDEHEPSMGGGEEEEEGDAKKLELRRSIVAIAEFQDDELGTRLTRKISKPKQSVRTKSGLNVRRGLRRRKKKKGNGFVGSLNESPISALSSRGGGGEPVLNPLFRTSRAMSAGI